MAEQPVYYAEALDLAAETLATLAAAKDATETFCIRVPKVIAIITNAAATLRRYEHDLAECYRLSGADPDGNEDWRLARDAVEAVRELRKNYDDREDACINCGRLFCSPGRSLDDIRYIYGLPGNQVGPFCGRCDGLIKAHTRYKEPA